MSRPRAQGSHARPSSREEGRRVARTRGWQRRNVLSAGRRHRELKPTPPWSAPCPPPCRANRGSQEPTMPLA
eukprot:1387152-Alexandrium_andersonii.AAC.1